MTAKAKLELTKINPSQFDLFFTSDQDGVLVDVFNVKTKEVDVTDKDGNVTGSMVASQTFSLQKMSEINRNLGLSKKDEDKRVELVTAAKDALKKKIMLMMQMMANDDTWTGNSAKLMRGRGKNGKVRVQFTFEQIERRISEIEKLAKAYNMTPEAIINLIKSQLDSLKPQEAETIDAETSEPEPETKPEEKLGEETEVPAEKVA